MHTEYAAAGKPLPILPGKIMANMWAGTGVDGWLGPFTYPGTPIYASTTGYNPSCSDGVEWALIGLRA